LNQNVRWSHLQAFLLSVEMVGANCSAGTAIGCQRAGFYSQVDIE
jgi:hypothetical protein